MIKIIHDWNPDEELFPEDVKPKAKPEKPKKPPKPVITPKPERKPAAKLIQERKPVNPAEKKTPDPAHNEMLIIHRAHMAALARRKENQEEK